MKTRPIIFNTDMVQAILRGQKRVTRRPVIPQPIWHPSARPPLWGYGQPTGVKSHGLTTFSRC